MHLLHPNPTPGRLAARRLLGLLAVGGVLAAPACSSSEGAASRDTAAAVNPTVLTPQDVVEARVADVTTGVLLTGSLEPADRALVTAQVGGTLGSITVDRGSRVSRGQRIATIQAAGVRSQAAGARAGVAAAEAQLAVARTQRDAQRRLFEAGASSRIDYENAQAAYAAAEAQVAAARAQATAAGEAAGYTTVTAPLSGVVSDRPAEPGEAVSPGDPILTIVNTTTLELAGRVPVDEAGQIRVGQPVTFRLDAFPGREFRGTVARKDPAADPSTRQVGIYVRLPNPGGEITAGQYARGQVSGRRLEDAVTIPTTAVQGTGSGAAVFVIENDRLTRRAVTLGPRDESTGVVAVTSGLRAGELVLARPAPSVAAGQPVVISSDEGAGAAVSPAVVPRDSTRRDSSVRAADGTRGR
jgi:RND family efflux transporter MFP subunit